MTRFLGRIAALTVTAIIVAVPAHAQDDSTSVRFQDVGFSFDETLGSSVAGQRILAGPGEGPSPAEVGHLVLAVSDVGAEGRTVPGPFRASGTVRAWRTADLEGEELAAAELEQLQGLLAERPDLGSFMTVVPASEINPLPWLPVAQAAQVLRARAEYVDTPQVAGVSYVAGFRQDVARFSSDDFVYTFQGISTDGDWYVAVEWVLTADGFPRAARTLPSDTRRNAWADYLNRSIERLNAADPASFTPSLTSLDALVRSITFEAGPVAAPSAAAEPSPAAVVSPAAQPSSPAEASPPGEPVPSPDAVPSEEVVPSPEASPSDAPSPSPSAAG